MPSAFVERHIRSTLVDALGEARAVCLLGARQAGKSTLAKAVAERDWPARYLTLDADVDRRGARQDPNGYIASLAGPTVIDEIQRAPELLLAIKQRLDQRDEPGQFLLTGSANILTLPTIADALPGRVDYLRLSPFSQGEINGHRETFLARLLEGEMPQIETAEAGRAAYAHRIATGGFPGAQHRSPRGRRLFFDGYIASLLGRDLADVAKVRDSEAVRRLLAIIASRSANLFSARSIAAEIEADHKTVAVHTKILEELFLLRRLPAWHVNLGNRHVKTPKLHVADTGLLAHLLNADAARIAEHGQLAGIAFETFAAMELLRQCDWAQSPPALFHYRDSAGREVDIVLELGSGEVAGVEVKSAATVGAQDFAGLRHLRDKLGGRFRAGALLYTGSHTVPFGDRLAAVPLCGLWSQSDEQASQARRSPERLG
jgi:uncharacterized protein